MRSISTGRSLAQVLHKLTGHGQCDLSGLQTMTWQLQRAACQHHGPAKHGNVPLKANARKAIETSWHMHKVSVHARHAFQHVCRSASTAAGIQQTLKQQIISWTKCEIM